MLSRTDFPFAFEPIAARQDSRGPFVNNDDLSTRMARLSIGLALVLTLIVITGWVAGIPALRSFLPGRIDMKLLTCLADLFAVALMLSFIALLVVTARFLNREETKRTASEGLLRAVALLQQEVVVADRHVQSVMDLIALRSQELTMADGAVVEIAEGSFMVYRAATGLAAPYVDMRIPAAGSLSGICHATGQAVRSVDIENDPRGDHAICREVGARSMLLVPLSHGRSMVGVLKVYSSRLNAFSADHETLLSMTAGLLGAVLTHSREFEIKNAALAEQAAEIEALRSRLESFVERSPAMAFMKDGLGNYLYTNAAFLEAVGDIDGDSLGTGDECWLSEEDALTRREKEYAVVLSGRPSSVTEELTIHGVKRWWKTFRFPLAEQRVLGGISIDVTQEHLAREQVNRLNVELEQRVTERTAELQSANEQLESFSYSVSHDLRAPLRAIDGYSRMLEEDYGVLLGDDGRRLINVVRESTESMGQLIGDLLEFSRVSKTTLHSVRTDMVSLADEVSKRLTAESRRPVRISVGDAPMANADRALIEQVVVNLLSNAIKYSEKTQNAEIRFSGVAEGDWLVYKVQDNGAGFDMRHAGKLFGVFQRLHREDEFEGTGVGLAIVKRIVERHGGRVWAEGQVGKGATFAFSLPAAA